MFLGPTLDPFHPSFREWGSAFCMVTSPPGPSDTWSRLRTMIPEQPASCRDGRILQHQSSNNKGEHPQEWPWESLRGGGGTLSSSTSDSIHSFSGNTSGRGAMVARARCVTLGKPNLLCFWVSPSLQGASAHSGRLPCDLRAGQLEGWSPESCLGHL